MNSNFAGLFLILFLIVFLIWVIMKIVPSQKNSKETVKKVVDESEENENIVLEVKKHIKNPFDSEESEDDASEED